MRGRQFPTLDIPNRFTGKSKTICFTFTFTLLTIYEVNGTAQYLEICWPPTNNDAILTLYLIHTLSLTISAFYRASTSPVSIVPIHPSIVHSINLSIDRYIHRSMHWSIDPSIHQSIHPSIHQLIQLIHQSIDPLVPHFVILIVNKLIA